MMQLMQMNSSPARKLNGAQALENSKVDSKEVSKEAAEFAAMVQGAQTQALTTVPAAAEKSQETSQVAASLNTAATIAGQQPWSKNWVFQGGDQNLELKPLIGDALRSDPDALQKQLETAQQNAPRSLMDLLGGLADSKDGEQLGKEILAREVPKQAAQAPKLGEQAELQLSALTAPQMDQVKTSDFMAGEELAELQGLGISEDGAERRGLEAGEFSSARMGKGALAKRTDGNAQSPLVMARPKLVSGADFLNMKKGMSGGGEKVEANRAAFSNLKDEVLKDDSTAGASINPALNGVQFQGQAAARSNSPIPLKLEVNGNVVPGAGTRDRLTSESVVGVSQSLMRLGAQGGGEIRLKLKPDALGEVRIGVISHGNSVSLQIHAMDEKAKRIVEESLGSLKDALATHSLQLAKVDLQVTSQPVLPSHNQMGADMDQGQRQNQNAFNSFDGQRDNRGQSEGQRSESGRPERLGLSVARTQAFSPARADGRLDVRA